MSNETFTLAIDVGSTNLKIAIFDSSFNVVDDSAAKMTSFLVKAKSDMRIDVDKLWKHIKEFLEGKIERFAISCIGVTLQRNSFVFWNKKTGGASYPLNQWNTKEGEDIADHFNNSLVMRSARLLSGLVYTVTRSGVWEAKSKFEFNRIQILPRLKYALTNDVVLNDDMLYGTLETWLLWKLTNGRIYMTTESFACVSGYYNITTKRSESLLLKYFGISEAIFPPIMKNFSTVTYEFSTGDQIPITALMPDQVASMYGCGCTQEGSLRISLGTATAITFNTGSKPIFKIHNNFYPCLAWYEGETPVYLYETTYESNYCIENSEVAWEELDKEEDFSGWLERNPDDLQSISTIDFVEDFIFKIYQNYLLGLKYVRVHPSKIMFDGGASRCKLFLYYMCNLTGIPTVQCSSNSTLIGVALAAAENKDVTKDYKFKYPVTCKPIEKLTGICRKRFQKWVAKFSKRGLQM